MNKSPAFQFYVDDFLGGTMHFTDAEKGLYITLLCVQWSTGSLPDDDLELKSYGKPSGLSSLPGGCVDTPIHRIKSKFDKGPDGRLRNERMEQERAKQEAFRLSRSKNGSKGCRPAKASGKLVVLKTKAKKSSPVSSLQSPDLLPEPSGSVVEGLEKESSERRSALSKLFNRRESTKWSEKEEAAFQAAKNCDRDDFDSLIAFYSTSGNSYLRRDLQTLLNNWNGEVDRAYGWKINPQKHDTIKPDHRRTDGNKDTLNDGRAELYANAPQITGRFPDSQRPGS